AGRPMSQGIVERFNGVLKGLIFRNITNTGKKLWVAELPKLVDNYNNTYHSTIGMSPNEVNKQNERQIFDKLKAKYGQQGHKLTNDLKEGDKVRVRLYKGKLEKYSKPNWTKEIYT